MISSAGRVFVLGAGGGVDSSGYPTETMQLRWLAVALAHLVDGPEAVGSRWGNMDAREG